MAASCPALVKGFVHPGSFHPLAHLFAHQRSSVTRQSLGREGPPPRLQVASTRDFPKATVVLTGLEFRLPPDFRSPKAVLSIPTVAGVWALRGLRPLECGGEREGGKATENGLLPCRAAQTDLFWVPGRLSSPGHSSACLERVGGDRGPFISGWRAALVEKLALIWGP